MIVLLDDIGKWFSWPSSWDNISSSAKMSKGEPAHFDLSENAVAAIGMQWSIVEIAKDDDTKRRHNG